MQDNEKEVIFVQGLDIESIWDYLVFKEQYSLLVTQFLLFPLAFYLDYNFN